MHSMLWSVFRQIEAGRAPEDNQRWSGLIEGYDCIARAVHPTNIVREYLNSAMWFWGDAGERGMGCACPDEGQSAQHDEDADE